MKTKTLNLLHLSLFAYAINAQELFATTNGTAASSCASRTSEPTYKYTPWAWSASSTLKYVTALPSPAASKTYALPYSDLSSLVPNASTTTWGSWLPGQTAVTADDVDDPYGNAAWQQLWINANLTNYTTVGLYSTTVSPTPIPSSELSAPPPNYFEPSDCYQVPDDFIYGGASAAGQIEGAIGLEGRTPGILERFVTNGTDVNSNYVTNEGYMLYKQDIARMAAAGMKYYSFSISWSRILPFGKANTPVNQEGIDHYEDVINTILEHGMQPVVTVHHFDTPFLFVDEQYPDRSYQALANARNTSLVPNAVHNVTGMWVYNGGFSHPEFVESFLYYSKIVFTHYADRVATWIIVNSPLRWGNTPTGQKNIIKAHAAAYRFYKDELKGTGQLGMKIGVAFPVPQDPKNETHIEAAQHWLDMYVGTLADPIILGKQFPAAYLDSIPGAIEFTQEELELINGTADFYAVNEYTAQIVTTPAGGIKACQANSSNPNWPFCVASSTVSTKTGWALGNYAVNGAANIPQFAIRSSLNYLWNTYKKPIIISEFGFPVIGESTANLASIRMDTPRSEYYLAYLSEMLKAMYEDGVKVIGALAWANFDNWEFGTWAQPYGLQYVNRTTQQRYYKKSFFDFVNFFESRMGQE